MRSRSHSLLLPIIKIDSYFYSLGILPKAFLQGQLGSISRNVAIRFPKMLDSPQCMSKLRFSFFDAETAPSAHRVQLLDLHYFACTLLSIGKSDEYVDFKSSTCSPNFRRQVRFRMLKKFGILGVCAHCYYKTFGTHIPRYVLVRER
jgi:hypothetical protein